MHSWIPSLKKAALVAVALFALLVPAHAGAATIVNGGFETGDLSGWQQYNKYGGGEWFVYDKADAEANSFFPPPSGNFAVVDNQNDPDLDILYQDVALEPAFTHQLALTFYYVSGAPITVPSSGTLNIDDEDNQQVRVDVVKPSAPIDSVSSSDILATLFANKNGDPEEIAPTKLSADLTPFAGQTVRLRIANAVNRSPFNTGLDDVSITSVAVPPPPPPPSNLISRGKLTLNKKKGTGKLAINVPGPGTLAAIPKGKGKTKRIRNASLTVTAAGTVKVPLNPNGFGKAILNENGKLKARIDVTFTPTGGLPNTQTYKATLKKTLEK
jgi:hypothetical protein